MTQDQKRRILEGVDLALALSGEEVDGVKVREAAERLLETEEFQEAPQPAGMMGYLRKLSAAVLAEVGDLPEQEIQHVPDVGKWSNEGPGPDPMLPGSGKIIG